MNLFGTINYLWQQFLALFQKEEEAERILPFQRINEATNWRLGQGLWSGFLPPLTTRLYYLEIQRTSYADKRELNIKPSPTHTFKLYYFSSFGNPPKKVRVSCFVVYENLYFPNTSEDYNAVELVGNAIAQHLQIITVRRKVVIGEKNEGKITIIKRPGELNLVEFDEGETIPVLTLISRQSSISLKYWKDVIDIAIADFKEKIKTDGGGRRG